MPEGRAVLLIRERTIGGVGAARAEVGQLEERVGFAWADTRLSEQGRSEEAGRLVEEARAGILEIFDIARGDVSSGFANVEKVLGQLTGVTPEEMSAAALHLGPVLRSAPENPEGLMRAYRRRFDDLASRRLLEETAESVMDALGGSDGGDFSRGWQALREELAAGRPAPELQAVGDRDALDGIASYLASAERVVNFSLNGLDPGVEVPSEAAVYVQRDVAAVNEYEALHRATTAASVP